MNAKSLATLFATTILAATFASTFAPDAKAGPFGMKALFCMNDEAREQIRQLKIMEQHYENKIANEIKGIAADKDALKAAEAALQNDVSLIGKGADSWPQNFNPQTDVDVQIKQINYLDRLIPTEESDLAADETELKLVQAWLRADFLGPCEEPPAPVVQLPGGTGTSDGGDLLNGPPVEPPVLADPNLPTDDGASQTDQPRSGFVDPPPPPPAPEQPGLWERFKKGCRSFFECQTEEEQKEEHKQALDQARKERASQTMQDVKSQTSSAAPTHATAPVEDVKGQSTRTALDHATSGAFHPSAFSHTLPVQPMTSAHLSSFAHMTASKFGVVDAVKSHAFGQTMANHLAATGTHGLTHMGPTGFAGAHGVMGMSKFGGFAGGLAGLGGLLIR